MDRSYSSTPQHSTAVRTAGSAPLDLLLPAAAGKRREPVSTSPARPAVSEVALLREPQNGIRTGGEPQTHPTADAHSGYRSSVSQTELEPPGAGSRSVSVPAARHRDRTAQSRLEHRYYLHSAARWLPILGRGDGLVQPFCSQLGTIQHARNGLLPGGTPGCILLRPTRNLQLRSGLAVHLGRLSGSAQAARDLDQHGWPRPRARQRFHRAAMALAQVRADLSRRLRQRPGTVHGVGKLFPLLQSPAPAPGARLPNAGRPVPTQTQKEEVIVMMGALPPNPRDLSLLFSRMDGFFFTAHGTCRTIEMLDRKVGQRRDATRAPIQARNGWRPSGRPLGQPAAPSKDCRNFVQTMGSTSVLVDAEGT